MDSSRVTAGTGRAALSDTNNGSSSASCCLAPAEAADSWPSADVDFLRRLSDNLGSLFLSPDFDFCADARIAVDPGREVGVHRCVLAARSAFFSEVFARREPGVMLEMRELVPGHEVGFDALVLVLDYLYRGLVGPIPIGVCACVDDECFHVGCRPAVDFMVQVLAASFTFQISELVSLFQRHLLDILEKVAIDDMPVILSVANLCSRACTRLLTRCIEIVVKSDLDIVTIEKVLPPEIVKQIMESRLSLRLYSPETSDFPDKQARRLYRALDSDDVELVRMLLKEGPPTLDNACALHYAVAHCDSKITTELLDLGLADVNHRNSRGYTILHIAAMRRDPKIIISLLIKGARPCELTLDGRKALQISRRLTKLVDYHRSTEEGKASPTDRLCIEVLEQAERRDPLIGEASNSLALAGDDLRVRLLYLENRVALARVLFPMEAKVAMEIAQVDGTLEFQLGLTSSVSTVKQGSTVDLNEAPFKIKEEHLSRLRALSRTVELGKRYFPRCSAVINQIVDDEVSDLTLFGDDTSEEQNKRYQELHDMLNKAFCKDKEDFDRCTMSSLSSSSSAQVAQMKK